MREDHNTKEIGELSEEQWRESIRLLITPFDTLRFDKEGLIRELKETFLSSVQARSSKKFALLLSGGVDSTLLAYLFKKAESDFSCISFGMGESEDLLFAEKAAKEYLLDHSTSTLTLDQLEERIQEVIRITKKNDPITVGVGLVSYCCALAAKKRGYTLLMSGLGSEELFAGYERHSLALKRGDATVHEECIKGLLALWEKDISRDLAICDHFRIKLSLPYLDPKILTLALSIHPSLKISLDEKKIILRETAQSFGLSKEFCWRKKKAAQYGSNSDKAIEKLSRSKGFATKGEYLRSLS